MVETVTPAQLLITRDWPGGVCPIHLATNIRCDPWCLRARIAFAAAADDLERYWVWMKLKGPA